MANDSNKDLTGLLEYSKKLHERGEFPQHPGEAAVAMEEVKIEPIAEFESLVDYGKSNPVNHEAHQEPVFEESSAQSSDSEKINDTSQDSADFPTTEDSNEDAGQAQEQQLVQEPAQEHIKSSEPEQPAQFEAAPFEPIQEEVQEAPQSEPEQIEPTQETTPEFQVDLNSAPPEFVPAPQTPTSTSSVFEPGLAQTPLPNAQALGSPASNKISTTQFSDRVAPGAPHVAAGYPFSLLIEGPLSESEKERLVDLLEKHQFGIRSIDLETQFMPGSDRVLIPRISEYAGVLLVQSLRDLRARMMLAPSDQINAMLNQRASETDHDNILVQADWQTSQNYSQIDGNPTQIHEIEITTENTLPSLSSQHLKIIDVLTASAGLECKVVEPKSSPEYQNTIDALMREIKLKAKIKGASAVLSLKIQLDSLSLPSLYRITVTGIAVQAHSQAQESLNS